MTSIVEQLADVAMREMWERPLAERGILGRMWVVPARLVYGLGLRLAEGELTLRAMSLVYTTLLSLVPLLAVSFSVLKAFGVHNQMEPVLMEFLAPLGEQGEQITRNILSFVENLKVGVLGSLGIALLFYTVISLVQKVEHSFNEIWRVESTRSLARRFSDYLSVILIGPVLIFSALGLGVTVMSSDLVQHLLAIEPFGTLILVGTRLLPYLLICAAFAFLYGVIPNTRVKPSAALVGGVFAGVLWYATGRLFTAFVVNSGNYSAIYSGFASLILFMIWLYLGWLILLMGVQVAFYWQNPRFLDPRDRATRLGHSRIEQIALAIMTLVGHAHYYSEAPWTVEGLVRRLNLRRDFLSKVVGALVRSRLLVTTGTNPPALLPARDIETIRLKEVMDALRRSTSAHHHESFGLTAVEEVMERVDAAIDVALADLNVKALALAEQVEEHESTLGERILDGDEDTGTQALAEGESGERSPAPASQPSPTGR